MAATPRNGVGRPRLSSQRTLEEAAAELFLEQGYARTTVDQIAGRAGVSRNTFFNYFGSKSDVLWVDVDAALAGLERELAGEVGDGAPMRSLTGAILDVAARAGAVTVPWALTQSELMGTADDLRASGLERLLRLQAVLGAYLARHAAPVDQLLVSAAAAASAGAILAAGGAWASAGVSRRPLAEYIDTAIGPVRDGFDQALAAS